MPIRNELVNASFHRAIILIDYDVHNDYHKKHEFIEKPFLLINLLLKMKN